MKALVSSLWFGRSPLSLAYWGVGLIGSLFVYALLLAAVQLTNQTLLRAATAAVAVVASAQYVFWFRSVDQCAKNVSHRTWAVLAKICLYLALPTYGALVIACMSRAVARFE